MKFNVKSFAAGFLAATVLIAAAGTAFAAASIKSAVFNANKIVFDGEELDLSESPMISVVKEGETDASNYMPLRGVLEQMGFAVDWDGAAKTVIVTSAAGEPEAVPSEENADEETMANMPNPWEACSQEEAFEYLGATFKIEPPEGYEFKEAATLAASFVGEQGKMARFTYRNADDELFRVHITAGGAKELTNQGEPVEANEIEAYYDKDGCSVSYAQDDFLVTIDMLEKGEDELLETIGSVTLAK